MNTATYQSKLMERLDRFVEQGTSEQLFAANYLQGHLSIATARCQCTGKIFPHDIKFQVVNSLSDAMQTNELSPQRQDLVLNMWETINH